MDIHFIRTFAYKATREPCETIKNSAVNQARSGIKINAQGAFTFNSKDLRSRASCSAFSPSRANNL